MTSATETATEMVRPHDLREGDRIRVAGETRTITVAPLPCLDGRRHLLVAGTDQGRVSWSLAAAQWACVERVAKAPVSFSTIFGLIDDPDYDPQAHLASVRRSRCV